MFFFFQAEDGIRDLTVTGVQTCALPILGARGSSGGSTRGGIYWTATVAGAARPEPAHTQLTLLKRWFAGWHAPIEIGRASCRVRALIAVGAVAFAKTL